MVFVDCWICFRENLQSILIMILGSLSVSLYLKDRWMSLLCRLDFFLYIFTFCFTVGLCTQEIEENHIKKINKKIKKCVLYGNCQMMVVYNYLQEKYPELYEYKLITNYLVLAGLEQFSEDSLKNADLLIYQPLKGHGNYDTDYVKQHYLKKNCESFSFPYIYFLGYFPDFAEDPNNIKTINTEAKFGYFPYGHKRIMDLIQEGIPPNKILEKSMHADFIPEEVIWEKYNYCMEILRKREKTTDIKLADFIEKHFRQHKLFHSAHHPTNFLLKELVRQILNFMKLKRVKRFNQDTFFDKELLDSWNNHLIYPCVVRVLNLEFDTSQAIYANRPVPYSVYIHDYIKLLYPDFYERH